MQLIPPPASPTPASCSLCTFYSFCSFRSSSSSSSSSSFFSCSSSSLLQAETVATPSSYSYLSLISDLVQAWLAQSQGEGTALMDCVDSNRDGLLEGIKI